MMRGGKQARFLKKLDGNMNGDFLNMGQGLSGTLELNEDDYL